MCSVAFALLENLLTSLSGPETVGSEPSQAKVSSKNFLKNFVFTYLFHQYNYSKQYGLLFTIVIEFSYKVDLFTLEKGKSV